MWTDRCCTWEQNESLLSLVSFTSWHVGTQVFGQQHDVCIFVSLLRDWFGKWTLRGIKRMCVSKNFTQLFFYTFSRCRCINEPTDIVKATQDLFSADEWGSSVTWTVHCLSTSDLPGVHRHGPQGHLSLPTCRKTVVTIRKTRFSLTAAPWWAVAEQSEQAEQLKGRLASQCSEGTHHIIGNVRNLQSSVFFLKFEGEDGQKQLRWLQESTCSNHIILLN